MFDLEEFSKVSKVRSFSFEENQSKELSEGVSAIKAFMRGKMLDFFGRPLGTVSRIDYFDKDSKVALRFSESYLSSQDDNFVKGYSYLVIDSDNRQAYIISQGEDGIQKEVVIADELDLDSDSEEILMIYSDFYCSLISLLGQTPLMYSVCIKPKLLYSCEYILQDVSIAS